MRGFFILAVRLILAGLFVYAGVVKMLRPDLFFGDILSYQLLPVWAALVVAYLLAPLEVLVGLGLLWKPSRGAAVLLGVAMMAVFIVAIMSAWARGLDISCGCFGVSSEAAASYPWLIFRDLLFIAAFLIAALPTHVSVKREPRGRAQVRTVSCSTIERLRPRKRGTPTRSRGQRNATV